MAQAEADLPSASCGVPASRSRLDVEVLLPVGILELSHLLASWGWACSFVPETNLGPKHKMPFALFQGFLELPAGVREPGGGCVQVM